MKEVTPLLNTYCLRTLPVQLVRGNPERERVVLQLQVFQSNCGVFAFYCLSSPYSLSCLPDAHPVDNVVVLLALVVDGDEVVGAVAPRVLVYQQCTLRFIVDIDGWIHS